MGMTEDGAREIVARNGWALAWFATILGVVIVLSSDLRWSSPVWRDALRVPGAPPTWGAIMLTAGLLLLVGCWRGSRRAFHVGCQIAFLWCCAVASLQISSLIHDDSGTANPIGLVVWCYMGYIFQLRFRGSSKHFRA